jgi:hypothetical protein
VTRKAALSNETIELSQSKQRTFWRVSPECNRMHVRGEMDFGLALRTHGTTEKRKSPAEPGF